MQRSRDLPRPAQVLDQLDSSRRKPGRAVDWGAGVIFQPGAPLGAIAGYPFRVRGPGDVEFRGRMSDRATSMSDLFNRSLSSKIGQRGIAAGHRTGLFLAVGAASAPPIVPVRGPFLHPHPGANNVKIHST